MKCVACLGKGLRSIRTGARIGEPWTAVHCRACNGTGIGDVRGDQGAELDSTLRQIEREKDERMREDEA